MFWSCLSGLVLLAGAWVIQKGAWSEMQGCDLLLFKTSKAAEL